MARARASLVEPRKTPRQARSNATVEAIRTATIQVLLAEGPARLTTTRVAVRAGVSVGTMYQYYPHKQALLFAVLEQKLDRVETTMLAATQALTGRDLDSIAHGLADAWLDAKTADIEASRAIYGIAGGFDIAARLAQGAERLRHEIGRLLTTAEESSFADVNATAFMVLALLAGSTRAVLEHNASERDLACLRRELPRACYGYLDATRRGISNVRSAQSPS